MRRSGINLLIVLLATSSILTSSVVRPVYSTRRPETRLVPATAPALPTISATTPTIGAPTTTGLVAYYKFDEGLGTSTADSSGNSLNGQFTGSWTNTDLPDIGFVNPNALSFNGTSDFVYIPPAAIDDLTAGTITAWVYLNSRDQEVITAKQHNHTDSMAIFSVGLSGASSGGSDIQTPGVLYFHAKNATGFNAAGVTALNVGQWYHVGVTFTSAQAKIYVNGILDSTTNGDFSVPSNLGNSTFTTLGAWLLDGLDSGRETNYLNGRLDEVRIYDRALSDIEMADFVTSSEFSIRAIAADKGGNSGDVSVSVLGGGFQPGTTVRLTAAGQPDIEGVSPIVVNRSRITTTFNLRGAMPGLRDVVVTLPDGSTATLVDGFTIEEGGTAQVWVDIIGRDTIRAGRPQTYNIIYGNRGLVDAVGVPLWIGGIPKDATLEIGFDVTAPIPLGGQATKDWSQIPIHVETDNEKLVPLFVPLVPTGGTGLLRISLTVPSQREFQLRAWATAPYYRSPIDPQVLACGSAIATVAIPRLLGSIPGVGCLGTITIALGESLNTAVEYSRTLPSAATSTVVFSLFQLHADAYDRVISVGGACVDDFVPPLAAINAAVQIGFAGYEIYNGCRDIAQRTWEKITPPIRTVQAFDPNDKVGAGGTGIARYISGAEPLRYAIYFENVETATAPAQEVVITDQLDAAKFDLNTVSLGPIAFGNKLVTPPPGLSEFIEDVDLRPANDLIVRINARLDKNTGLLTWRFASIDPATGLPTEDPLAGFLPPNVNAPEGDGSVLFTVLPKQGLVTGTEIRNQAQIIFDTNAPIDTPQWLNTLDNSAPASNVHALNAIPCSANINVQWSGMDTGSGIRDYNIFVSDNGSPFTNWQSHTIANSGTYAGQFGHTYAFYSMAQDQTGNIESAPAGSDATVTLIASTQPPAIILTRQAITLWPANHQYKTVSLSQLVESASSNCGGNLTGNVVIAQVSSDEPENAPGGGDGNTLNDIVIAPNCKSVQLRVERQGSGNGRVYTITFRVSDAAGNNATATAKVRVPMSQNGNPAVNDGQSYIVKGSCP